MAPFPGACRTGCRLGTGTCPALGWVGSGTAAKLVWLPLHFLFLLVFVHADEMIYDDVENGHEGGNSSLEYGWSSSEFESYEEQSDSECRNGVPRPFLRSSHKKQVGVGLGGDVCSPWPARGLWAVGCGFYSQSTYVIVLVETSLFSLGECGVSAW